MTSDGQRARDALRLAHLVQSATRPAGERLLLHTSVAFQALGIRTQADLVDLVGQRVRFNSFLPVWAGPSGTANDVHLEVETTAETPLVWLGAGSHNWQLLAAAGLEVEVLQVGTGPGDTYRVRVRVAGLGVPPALATPLIEPQDADPDDYT